MKAIRLAFLVVLLPTLGAGNAHLDSQYVLQRYALAVQTVPAPSAVVYSYTVSQVGATNIEQHHRIFREGLNVRDETLSIDGITLTRKMVRFGQREDRYAVARFAPAAASYEMLFLGTVKDARHFDYVYEATPLVKTAASWVDKLTIDGDTFLPRAVHFHSVGVNSAGVGEVEFAAFGKYWMPVLANVTARVDGKPAHERIVWMDYRFPPGLPPSTFQSPKPLPPGTLPQI